MNIKAYAKINPYLNIVGRRDDGYHELDIVFYPISLCDELEVELISKQACNGVQLSCSIPEFSGKDNIIYKAYDALAQYASTKGIDFNFGFKVNLKKNIPSGAGMGGGSSDAAAFLIAANKLSGISLDLDELLQIGAKVGADVPACLIGRPSIASGIGEKLRPFKPASDEHYIAVKPSVSFITAKMYADYDKMIDDNCHKPTMTANDFVSMAERGEDLSQAAFNVFEQVVPDRQLIQSIKRELLEAGALYSLMTGSGSCVFGAFSRKETRDAAFESFKKQSDMMQVYSCELLK